jgi:SAM-dependent methyltransferase
MTENADPEAELPPAFSQHVRRARAFGAAAAAYAEHRPDYPIAAITWALEPLTALPGHLDRPAKLLDLGAGTGKLTTQLASLPVGPGLPQVVAVEPDPEMLAELHNTLRKAQNGSPEGQGGNGQVTVLCGQAEEIPMPDASMDAVLAGQAAHWFDLEVAIPEIARVLAPGGVFAGLWNASDDRVEWVAGLADLSGRHGLATVSMFSRPNDEGFPGRLSAAGRDLFAAPEFATFEHAHPRTADSLIETLSTHSMFLIMEPEERDATLSRVREYLAVTPQTALGEFNVPIVTMAVRAVRR